MSIKKKQIIDNTFLPGKLAFVKTSIIITILTQFCFTLFFLFDLEKLVIRRKALLLADNAEWGA